MDIKDVCIEIENDDFYNKYLTDSFKTMIIDNLSVTDQVAKLSEGIEKLNQNLKNQVLAKHDNLLGQASYIADLESALASVKSRVDSLICSAGKLKDKVYRPYQCLENQTITLERIQTTCDLLKHTNKVLILWKRLSSIEQNPAKEATVLFELQELISNNDFNNIFLLEDILKKIKHKRQTLLADSKDMLESGLVHSDKVKLLQCFKVFHNLQCTDEQIKIIVGDILDNIRIDIRNALNIQSSESKKSQTSRIAPGKANIMTSQEFKIKLWDNIENLFKNVISTGCAKVILLQNVVNELHAIGNYRNIAKDFWFDLIKIISEELEKSTITVNQSVEIDFPRLLKCFNDLLATLKHKNLALDRSSLKKWENGFLSKSLGKLLEPVRSMWHTNQVPTLDQIDNAVRVITEALSISLGDKQLSISLANSVAKCIKQMNMETEQRLCLDSDVGQIVEPPTNLQQKNAELCNVSYYFSMQIKRVLNNMSSSLPNESVQIIKNSLKDISSMPVLEIFVQSIKESIYLILSTMHDELDFSKTEDPEGKSISCSAYMRELQQFISRSKDIYLTMFHEKPALKKCCETISKACITRFIQHACNLKPLTKYGRAKLHADCQHLEISLKPLIGEIIDLGDHYRQLKSLSVMLKKTLLELTKQVEWNSILPYSLMMMYLFSFSGPQLLAPHACAGWSVSKLMQWLDSHSNERERLEFVAGALQRYQNHARQNELLTYDEVYPLLLRLLDEGRKSIKP